MFLGAAKHLGDDDRNQLTVEAISAEALTTLEIEGVQFSIQRQLGLTADKRRVGAAEQGISEMMIDLYESSSGSGMPRRQVPSCGEGESASPSSKINSLRAWA